MKTYININLGQHETAQSLNQGSYGNIYTSSMRLSMLSLEHICVTAVLKNWTQLNIIFLNSQLIIINSNKKYIKHNLFLILPVGVALECSIAHDYYIDTEVSKR